MRVPSGQNKQQTFYPDTPRRHAVADFFTAEVWTMRGLVRFHVLFVMTLDQRQVKIAHIGCQTDGVVMAQVARNLTAYDGALQGIKYFVCDHDPHFTQQFRHILKGPGSEVIRTRVGCPQQNGYARALR